MTDQKMWAVVKDGNGLYTGDSEGEAWAIFQQGCNWRDRQLFTLSEFIELKKSLGYTCQPVTVSIGVDCRTCLHFLSCSELLKSDCKSGDQFKPSQPIQLYAIEEKV